MQKTENQKKGNVLTLCIAEEPLDLADSLDLFFLQ